MSSRPKLTRALARTAGGTLGVEMPPAHTLDLPERAVQFGTGALLRGFVDYFIDEANRKGQFGGSIVAVSSTGSGRDDALNAQDGLYTLVIRGLTGGAATDCRRMIASVSRAISATQDWESVVAVARDPNIELVFSNTTEAGIVLDEGDRGATPPRSFPGKLTRFLYERATAFDYDAARGVVVIPCELIENNGATLREMVGTLATRWKLGARFDRWLADAVPFCDTLVDRIVTGAPAAGDVEGLAAAHGYDDAMLTVCEPYRLFAIQAGDAVRPRLRFASADAGIIVASDIAPYRERKVRVLNGAHTSSVSVALLAGLDTVRSALADERVGRFMRHVVFEEIVPSLSVPEGEAFAAAVLERFANPFVDHALVDITLQGSMKMRTRVVPSVVDYQRRFGRAPAGLALGFAAFLLTMRAEARASRRAAGQKVPDDVHADTLARYWRGVDETSPDTVAAFVAVVVDDHTLWGRSLAGVPGFAAAVTDHVTRAARQGIHAALDAHFATGPATLLSSTRPTFA